MIADIYSSAIYNYITLQQYHSNLCESSSQWLGSSHITFLKLQQEQHEQ